MRAAFALAVSLVVPLVSARLSCVVKGLGAGQDDGPQINAAFARCRKKGHITLAGYYSVDTLLFASGLDDVKIELSGTRAYSLTFHGVTALSGGHSTVHARHCQVVADELLPRLPEQLDGVLALREQDQALWRWHHRRQRPGLVGPVCSQWGKSTSSLNAAIFLTVEIRTLALPEARRPRSSARSRSPSATPRTSSSRTST
jgi:hypothetical protein